MSRTGMQQRCWEHDYCAPCFYMITLVTQPRRECLGELCTQPAAPPHIERSALGQVVLEVWRRTSTIYPGVEACEAVVMPDHFHGLLRVKKRLPRPMGHLVKAFKRVSTNEGRRQGLLCGNRRQASGSRGLASGSRGLLPQPNWAAAPTAGPSSLWQPGFQDSILLRRGQLKAMVNYIADNPRRLAAKRANPELFTVVTRCQIAPNRACAMIGNRFLLEHPLKRQIQISRHIPPAALQSKTEELLYATQHGAVPVSPCISPGEKEIARALLAVGAPLIVLLENGFPPGYKPPGRYFDACAQGRLLMLAPFPYHREKRPITRAQCLALNDWAAAVAAVGSDSDLTSAPGVRMVCA